MTRWRSRVRAPSCPLDEYQVRGHFGPRDHPDGIDSPWDVWDDRLCEHRKVAERQVSWRGQSQRPASHDERSCNRNEAVALEAQLTLKMGSEPDPSGVAMAELFAGQLDQSGYSATTHADLKSIVHRLPESFLAREVGRVTPAVLDGLYRQLTADGLVSSSDPSRALNGRKRVPEASHPVPLGQFQSRPRCTTASDPTPRDRAADQR
ncbi:MAG: hypothetical protein JWN62_161 [Acidimicrobiales bacterium]|nr:hypothetical protein [Acidimicrobiales bacterium]